MMPSSDRGALLAEGRAIVEALGGRWNPRGAMCRCPAHDDALPSLSVRPGDRQVLFHCFAGCATADIMRALRKAGLVREQLSPRRGFAAGPTHPTTLSPLARRLWSAAGTAESSPAAHYLRSRGLRGCSRAIRFHARTPIGRAPLTSFRPAMIAAVHDDAGFVGIHRTFLDLTSGRTKPIVTIRRALGRLSRGAVRLDAAADGVLGLAEGVETALSAAQLFDIPCWATLGTERFRHVVIPRSVRKLILFLDNDAGGRRAERLAREVHASASFSIEAIYPKQADEDWNDVLRQKLGIVGRTPEWREESEAVVQRTG